MKPITVVDLYYARAALSAVKKPSRRVKDAIQRIDDSLCRMVEGLQDWTYTQQPGKETK